jgi:hypothetical protein
MSLWCGPNDSSQVSVYSGMDRAKLGGQNLVSSLAGMGVIDMQAGIFYGAVSDSSHDR